MTPSNDQVDEIDIGKGRMNDIDRGNVESTYTSRVSCILEI